MLLLFQVNSGDITSSLSSTLATYSGAQISRDVNGITAIYTDSNNVKTTLFYDGTFLYITNEGNGSSHFQIQHLKCYGSVAHFELREAGF